VYMTRPSSSGSFNLLFSSPQVAASSQRVVRSRVLSPCKFANGFATCLLCRGPHQLPSLYLVSHGGHQRASFPRTRHGGLRIPVPLRRISCAPRRCHIIRKSFTSRACTSSYLRCLQFQPCCQHHSGASCTPCRCSCRRQRLCRPSCQHQHQRPLSLGPWRQSHLHRHRASCGLMPKRPRNCLS